jgi:hypothetical protein
MFYEKNYNDSYLNIIFYVLFFPLPTAKLAIRKDIFFSLHPIKAFTTNISKGKILDPELGRLYELDGFSRRFIYVKKIRFGWVVTSQGTGP